MEMDYGYYIRRDVPVDSFESPDRPGMDAQNTTENRTTVVETPWGLLGIVCSWSLMLVVVPGLCSWLLQPVCRTPCMYSVYVPAHEPAQALVLVPVQLRGRAVKSGVQQRDELKISTGGEDLEGRGEKETKGGREKIK